MEPDKNLLHLTEKWAKGDIDNISYAKKITASIVAVACNIGSGAIGLALAHTGFISGIPIYVVAVGLSWMIQKILGNIGDAACKWIMDYIFPNLEKQKQEQLQKEALKMFGYKSIKDIDQKDLRKRYKQLARDGVHPDKGGTNEKFTTLSDHYLFLMEHVKSKEEVYLECVEAYANYLICKKSMEYISEWCEIGKN